MKQLLFITLTLLSVSAFAQGSLDKGRAQINAGFGFSTWGVPVYIGTDIAVHESITIGGKFSYRNYAHRYAGYKYSQSLSAIGINGNYHFNKVLRIPSKFDFYAGVTIGYYVWSNVKWDGVSQGAYGGEASGIGAEVQLGGRYFFNDKLAVNLELGSGTGSGMNMGLTYKL
jgi:outer membrane immunogenic protein